MKNTIHPFTAFLVRELIKNAIKKKMGSKISKEIGKEVESKVIPRAQAATENENKKHGFSGSKRPKSSAGPKELIRVNISLNYIEQIKIHILECIV